MKPKVNENGLRLLATYKILHDYADPSTPISAGQLRKLVAEYLRQLEEDDGIYEADRRTLYQDIETLRRAGYTIEKETGTRGRYSMEPDFEAWELRFLADAIRTSRSLTKDQGVRLLQKIKSLASSQTRKSLNRRFIVQGQFHNGMFRQTAYALHEIESALDMGCKLSFKMVDYLADGTARIRKDPLTGKAERIATPIEYVYSSDGFYYLIILDSASESGVKTPRIDRMIDIKALADTSADAVSSEQKDAILQMFKRSFGMFEKVHPTSVELVMETGFVKTVMDRFGDEAAFCQWGDGKAKATVTTNLSDNFYSWIDQFAGRIVITAPNEAREGMISFLERNARPYKR